MIDVIRQKTHKDIKQSRKVETQSTTDSDTDTDTDTDTDIPV